MRRYSINNKWCIHSYYTISPYAPDNSERVLISGADLETNKGRIYILDKNSKILDCFGENTLFSAFFHTGYWQTWSADGKKVYYQAGTPEYPKIGIYDTISGDVLTADGDMEGTPPFGNPIVSGLMGMLYASGYADGKYHPEKSPIPFEMRSKHGIFVNDVYNNTCVLKLSIDDIIKRTGLTEKICELDNEVKARLGKNEKMTLMAYCVRWNRDGSRMLFYFGNHCTDARRKEKKVSMIFTCTKNFEELSLAIDLSGKKACHWSWHPDGVHLIGYVEVDREVVLGKVKYDGTDFEIISKSNTCGHPSICPTNHNILLTDNYEKMGQVEVIDLTSDKAIRKIDVPRVYGEIELPGRNPMRICNHPTFSPDGKKIIMNALPGRYAELWEFAL